MIADPILFAFRLPETAAMVESAECTGIREQIPYRSLFTTWRGTNKKYVYV
jgi:hypothetical protein